MSHLFASPSSPNAATGWNRSDSRLALLYLCLAALFYSPLLLGLRTFPDGDFTHHFLPFSRFLQQELLAGRLPVWNPYTYSGHPFLADVQAAVFYPLSNLLLLLTAPFGSAAARLYFLQVEVTLHIALAGIFVYLLVRDLTSNRGAAFLSGCVFAFSGYLTGYPPLQLAILRTAVWLPLILWLLLHAFRHPFRWHGWIGAALAYATALLAGHAQTFLHLSYVVAAWILLLGWMRYRQNVSPAEAQAPWHAYLGGVLAFYVLALGLSAAQLWPSVEFTRLSVRANLDYAALSGGFPLQDTWQLLFPGGLTHFSPLYVSLVGLGLALCAWWHLRAGSLHQEGRPLVLFFWILTLMALLVAYGDNGFLYTLFYRFAPGWDLFRGQERAAYLVAFGLSVLAGFGVAALNSLSRRQRRSSALVFAGVVMVGLVLFGFLWQLAGRTQVTDGEFLFRAILALGLTAGFVLVVGRSWSVCQARLRWQADRATTGTLVMLILVDLFWANATTNLDAAGPAEKADLRPEVAALQSAVHESQQAGSFGVPGRAHNEYRVYENYGMDVAAEEIWGSSPLRLVRYAALFDGFPVERLWQLTGVQHVLTWRHEVYVPAELLAEFPQVTDTTYLHRITVANPRAWVVHEVRVAEDTEALQILADFELDLHKVGVVAPEDSGALGIEPEGGKLAAEGHNVVRMGRLRPNRLRVSVDSEHGGLLIISENWLPGWYIRSAVCSSDDGPCPESPLVRVNLTFLGVSIAPGETVLAVEYWPNSLRYGLVISGATLLILGVGVLRILQLSTRFRATNATSMKIEITMMRLRS